MDPSNLTMKAPYNGSQQVVIGNGVGIPIKNIGHATFLSPFVSQPLHLKSILHTPHITKNLMSVRRFAQDNDAYFEFHANKCLVKSQGTHKVLLQGTTKEGLYIL